MVEIIETGKTMTIEQAKRMLRWYYVALEIIKKYDVCRYELPSPGVNPIGSGGSTQDDSIEAWNTIKKVSLEQDVEPIRIAINQLPHVDQNFIMMRFQLELSLRAIGRELHYSKTAVQKTETRVLAGFIEALGRMPIE